MIFPVLMHPIKTRRQHFTPQRRRGIYLLTGILIAVVFLLVGSAAVKYTSSDNYCMSCHVHPHAEQAWRLSAHYNNRTGSIVHCYECHTPPAGQGYLFAKAKHGLHDLYGFWFKDSADYNWEAKRQLEAAKKFVYEESCLSCHANLFPVSLSVKGGNAHLFYTTSREPLNCINCHLNVGHYDRNNLHAHDSTFGLGITAAETLFDSAAVVTSFSDYSEMIPGTAVSFDMVAIPGGSFNMGSPDTEAHRDADEGPVRKVTLSSFWMSRNEVSWDEYMAFFRATSSQGRTEGQVKVSRNTDAISGATPPWGAPDQGWGKGSRPAITMSWHAATVYCQWLSKVTGKKYRLPTEAEWEYACRAGTATPYFFGGDPRKYSSESFLRKILGPDTSTIASYVVYRENSVSKTHEPAKVKANAFGLKNMSGNVAEFCLDYYSADIYKADTLPLVNPRGPSKGKEHVIRGGSFKSDAADVRSASRDFTRTKEWLITDPQMPKSIWWYSDCIDVGFRVVCEEEVLQDKK